MKHNNVSYKTNVDLVKNEKKECNWVTKAFILKVIIQLYNKAESKRHSMRLEFTCNGMSIELVNYSITGGAQTHDNG